MKLPILTFFNNKGGVGKTSLIYHLAWMFARLNKRIIVIDLDPQASLTAAFLDEDRIEKIWNQKNLGSTVFHCVKPLTGVGDVVEPRLQEINPDLYLLPGDVNLSNYEEMLATEWPNSMGDNNLYRPMRIISSFWQVMQRAANQVEADIILVDISSNLGAINRSVLLATNYVAIPLGADLFSLQGLSNLGPTLRSWKNLWKKRLDNWNSSQDKNSYPTLPLPTGDMQPIGYLCQQHSVRLSRPVQALDKWVQRIPGIYRQSVLNESYSGSIRQQDDPYCLATIKHYRSLVPLAQEHRKPIFNLSSAEGAIGSHASAVLAAKNDFKRLAGKIAQQIGVTL